MATTHRALINPLSRQRRQQLLARSDGPGLWRLAVHGVGIVALGSLIAYQAPFWPLLLVPQGILIVFLFAAMHESIHRTAFRSPWLNRAVASLCGFLLLVPPRWFRLFHMAHHRHTRDPRRDPERATASRRTRAAYLWHLSGLPLWRDQARTIVANALDRSGEPFVPARQRRAVADESRRFLILYALVAIGSVAAGSDLVVWTWLAPALAGQPFLRAFLLAEHADCPTVPDMLRNSRTTRSNGFVRFITWNMTYHAEHHALPAAPFHKLPALHAVVGPHLSVTETGYLRFHRVYWASLSAG